MNTLYSLLLPFLLLQSNVELLRNGGLNERHQAMYLINLVRNVDWHTDKVTIGVIGDSPVTEELSSLAARNSKIEVKVLESLSSITECNIAFLPDATNSSFFVTQKEIGDAPVILVVDKKELVVRGAEMGFYMENDKMKIAMNPKAIEETGIKVSAALMEKAALN